jgi:hypothetical protein
MKKLIAAILLSSSLAGCAGWKAEVNTQATHAVYKDERKQAFIDLVMFVRENRFNTKMSQEVQQRLDRLVFEAGMEMKTFPNGKRRLIYNNYLISFDDNLIQIEYSPTSSIKVDDLDRAADIIYGNRKAT